jgi:hypothetical protein
MSDAFRAYDHTAVKQAWVVALSRGLSVRFKSARFVLVAGDDSALAATLNRIGVAEVCCVSEMMKARALCDAGGIAACLVVLPRALPDDKPGWDARTNAPGRGSVPSLLFAEAATPYVRRSAADAGYHAVVPIAVSSRMLYRCIGALLQAGRPQSGASERSHRLRVRTRDIRSVRKLSTESPGPGKLKLQ